jgi:hypothetical protein
MVKAGQHQQSPLGVVVLGAKNFTVVEDDGFHKNRLQGAASRRAKETVKG